MIEVNHQVAEEGACPSVYLLLSTRHLCLSTKFGGLSKAKVGACLKEIEAKNLTINEAKLVIENAKYLQLFSHFLTSCSYMRLCLIVFVVHYLDFKFKVEKGQRSWCKERHKKDKDKTTNRY